MREKDDIELKEVFQDLRHEDAAGTPEFRTLWDRARKEASGLTSQPLRRVPKRPSVSKSLKWGGAVLAVAAASGLLLFRVPATSDSEFVQIVQAFSTDPAGGAWRSPTDDLLEFPGGDVLSTVPTLDKPYWLPDMGAGSSRNES